MKIDNKGYITLTPKESETITELLWTLAAMGGTNDDEFNKEANKAGKFGDQILYLRKKHETGY